MRNQYKILQEVYEQVGAMTLARAQEVVNSIHQCNDLQQAIEIFKTCPDLAKFFNLFEGELSMNRTGDRKAWFYVQTAAELTVLNALRIKGMFNDPFLDHILDDKLVKRAIRRSVLFDYQDYESYLKAFTAAVESTAKYTWATVNRPGDVKRNGLLFTEANTIWHYWKNVKDEFKRVMINFDARKEIQKSSKKADVNLDI